MTGIPTAPTKTFLCSCLALHVVTIAAIVSALVPSSAIGQRLNADVTVHVRWASKHRLDDTDLSIRFTRLQGQTLQPLFSEDVFTTRSLDTLRVPVGLYLVHVLLEDLPPLWTGVVRIRQANQFLPIGVSIQNDFGMPREGSSFGTLRGKLTGAKAGERYWLKLVPIWRNEDFFDLLASNKNEFRFDGIRLGPYLLVAIRDSDSAVVATRALDVTFDRADIAVDLEVGSGMAGTTPTSSP